MTLTGALLFTGSQTVVTIVLGADRLRFSLQEFELTMIVCCRACSTQKELFACDRSTPTSTTEGLWQRTACFIVELARRKNKLWSSSLTTAKLRLGVDAEIGLLYSSRVNSTQK